MRIHSIKKLTKTEINGLILFSVNQYSDNRGFFEESWNELEWKKILMDRGQTYQTFVQDNFSRSKKGILRGMHYQIPPHA